jgi:hypothetical protein
MRKLCALLNKNAGGTLKNWKCLARAWEVEEEIITQFDNPEKPSPTKILLLEWLINAHPNFTVNELCEHLGKMKRNDARLFLEEKLIEQNKVNKPADFV